MAQIQFDASQVAPQQPIEALPAGWYKAALTTSDMEPTNDGTGMMLKCEYSILEGAFKGRKIFDRLNLQNKNPQAVEIAQQALSALCHATGVIRITDSQQLHNIPFFIKIKVDAKRTEDSLKNQINPATQKPYNEGDPGTKTYEAQNRVNGYKNINDVPAGYTGGGTAAPAGAAPAAGGPPAPDWANKKAPTAAPAAAPAASAPATTSNAVPPFMQQQAAAPAAEAPAKPKGPKGPKAKAAPAAEEPKFYVYFSDTNMPVKTKTQILADLKAGMPPDTQILPEAEIKADEPKWVDASTLLNAAPVAPVAAPVTGAVDETPPWERQ
jgi:hypothetical protein